MRLGHLFAGLCVAAAAVATVGWYVRRPHLPAAERGRRLAERTGCFACHGPEGSRGAVNAGRRDGTVPTFEGDIMMFARSPAEIREWIRDGVSAQRSQSLTWRQDEPRGVLKMPAFGDRLSESEIDDLTTFVWSLGGTWEPRDSLAAVGMGRAEALGCAGCHGARGQFARPNPKSMKGYVAAWNGEDFPELVATRTEFDEWVQDGVSRRFARNRLARFFLERAVLRMPAYRAHLEPDDLDALWAYVQWLRRAQLDQAAGHTTAAK